MLDPANSTGRVKAGKFEVDLRSGELWRNGEKIKLQQRPFQILAALLEKPGEVVTREDIQQKVWATETFVDFEHSINTAVKKLREALGDDPENPTYIQTLPRRGYRFVAPVEVTAANGSRVDIGPTLPAVKPDGGSDQQKRKWWLAGVGAGVLATLFAAVTLDVFRSHAGPPKLPSPHAWVQVTHFADGATSPAFSRDGRMMAFIRGPETFISRGQIYVKILPDGVPAQLTHDDTLKMAPAFSPDGSRIAFTVTHSAFGWSTWVVPVLGGEPRELLPNAAALTWIDAQHVMFSEVKTGTHMGIVSATESRSAERDLYLPVSVSGMAHRSWVSPDGKWMLVSEMDVMGWRPCRVIPSDGNTTGQTVGPKMGRCTYAGWSPDGKTMYFSADAGDGYHIWRQSFPMGVPEQLSFGPTEEEGVAISPDGRALVTSAGIRESTVWLHDKSGDRPLSGEGFATVPGLGFGSTVAHSAFSADGSKLFYLLRKSGARSYQSGELWMYNLPSGRTELVLPGVSMSEFDIESNLNRVAFTSFDAEGNSHAWIAPLDRSKPPEMIVPSIARQPCFGPGGDVYVLVHEMDREFVYRVVLNQSVARKMSSKPYTDFSGISPSGNLWMLNYDVSPEVTAPGGTPVPVCHWCSGAWGQGGKYLYLRFRDPGEMGGGVAVAIALSGGKQLPELPPDGYNSVQEVKEAAAKIDMSGKTIFAPGPDPSVYAYVKATVQRNLFSITLE